MERVLARFAVGSPGGPRSGAHCLRVAPDGTAIHLSARAGTARFTATIPASQPEICRPSADGARLTRESLRQAVAAGRWAAGDDFVARWPGQEISPGVCELLSICIPSSVLRVYAEAVDGPEPRWIPSPAEFGQVNVNVLVGRSLADGLGGTLLGKDTLSDGREVVAACSVEGASSRLQKAGLFGAIRKRQPPDVPQGVLAQPSTRLVLIWRLDGSGVFTEIAGDMFFTPGSC